MAKIEDKIKILKQLATKSSTLLPSTSALRHPNHHGNRHHHHFTTITTNNNNNTNTNNKQKRSVKFEESNNEAEIQIPTIPEIPEEEFQSLPKYIVGRITRQKINQQISILNEMIITKYTTLLANTTTTSPSNTIVNVDLNRIKQWKQEQLESPELENAIFLTDIDIKENRNLPVTSIRSMLSLLKSFSRLREVRAPTMTSPTPYSSALSLSSSSLSSSPTSGATRWVVLL